ncbi:MAG TPA: ergothioneine biosynthesis protein EgtC [Pseudonocardiaceae bacterium]|jgi:glutamine amidotransferase
MCRHLAYLGPPRTLAQLVLQPPHSLLHQSYAPRDMRGGGTINADGFGVGWYLPGVAEPVRYRRSRPLWTDDGFAALAEVTISGAVLAAVRSATVGTAVVETACAPFTCGGWLFSHNGMLPGWPESAVALAAGLDVAELMTLDAPIDSALLWAVLRRRLTAGEDPATAVAAVVRAAVHAVPDARLNLLLTDGTAVVATAWWHALSVRASGGALMVASEPTDHEPGWQAVPDRHLVLATPSTVDVQPLELW